MLFYIVRLSKTYTLEKMLTGRIKYLIIELQSDKKNLKRNYFNIKNNLNIKNELIKGFLYSN